MLTLRPAQPDNCNAPPTARPTSKCCYRTKHSPTQQTLHPPAAALYAADAGRVLRLSEYISNINKKKVAMEKEEIKFLPVTPEEVRERGQDVPDFVYVCGDAYVDHPSFGAALICRVLEANGFLVAMLPQPEAA